VSTDLTGHLLVSNATLFDPNFRRTVVLIGHHDEEGAVGVVLNRPLGVTVEQAVPPLSDLVDGDGELFEGGPVQPQAAVVIAEFLDPAMASVVAFGSVGFLPEEVEEDDRPMIVRARIFVGYSGGVPASSRPRSKRTRGSRPPPPRPMSSRPSPRACGRRSSLASVRPMRCFARCRPTHR